MGLHFGGRGALAAIFAMAFSGLAHAGPIQFAELTGFVHASGGLITQLNSSSSGYSSSLDSNNLGTFGWTFTNGTGSTLNAVQFLLFLDADIDRDLNTFFNEYGTFISLGLPPGSPGGAIAASTWEIDEPGFVFGNIYNNLLAGTLDNTNGVPSSAPDDVSLALGFSIGTLAPGSSFTITMRTSLTNIGGLSQTDPGSGNQFFLNGYAETAGAPTETVPEPTTAGLIAIGILALAVTRARSRR